MEIELINATKSIKKKLVLDCVNMKMETGKVYGLVGENGSGKTMLLRVLAGLLHLDGGKIKIDNISYDRMDLKQVTVGLVLENTTLYGQLTGFENLMYLGNLRSDTADNQVWDIMRSVGLDPMDKRKVSSYSLGMKQKLALAQAFLEHPQLLLLDEPTNALDEEGCKKIQNLIMERKNEGITLLVSHDKNVISELCDQIYEISDGKVRVQE